MVALIRIALVLVIASCAPLRSGEVPSAAVSPSAPAPVTCTSGHRLDFLADEFFVRYNARDLDSFLALFNFGASAGGGGFGSYTDNFGEAKTTTDRTNLSAYVRGRWAMDDRFLSWTAASMPDGLNYPNANPSISFKRSVAGSLQRGNAKLVCNAGLLIDVVMSSEKQ